MSADITRTDEAMAPFIAEVTNAVIDNASAQGSSADTFEQIGVAVMAAKVAGVLPDQIMEAQADGMRIATEQAAKVTRLLEEISQAAYNLRTNDHDYDEAALQLAIKEAKDASLSPAQISQASQKGISRSIEESAN